MSSMIKVGIIGMGLRGKMYAEIVENNPYSEFISFTESNNKARELLTNQYPKVNNYSNFEEMLAEENLDIIIVATPDFLHKDPVIAAANKKVNILVEKPFSTDVEETLLMKEAIDKNNVKCLVAFENRWNTPFVAVKEAINQGEIGEIITLNSRLNDTIFVPTQMLKWSNGSSPGWFLLSHSIDLACWFKNGVQPKSVYAVGTKKKLIDMGIDTLDSIQATITFEDDTHATFTTNWILPESMPMMYDFKYEVVGNDGALYIDLSDQMVRHAGQKYQHIQTLGTTVNNQLTTPPTYMLNSFIDNVRLGTEPESNPADGLLNTIIVQAIHKSVQTGTIQDIKES